MFIEQAASMNYVSFPTAAVACISFDVDILDPTIISSTGVPEENGISIETMKETLLFLKNYDNKSIVSIAVLNENEIPLLVKKIPEDMNIEIKNAEWFTFGIMDLSNKAALKKLKDIENYFSLPSFKIIYESKCK